jgi:serine phosphatase RsbU (regulator of sigma subunit)
VAPDVVVGVLGPTTDAAAVAFNGFGVAEAEPRRVAGMPDENSFTLLGSLIRALDAAPPYLLATVLYEFLKSAVGAQSATVLLADYEERTLEPVPDAVPSQTVGAQRIEGSEAGRAYREQRVVEVAMRDGGVTLYFPVTQRAERVGVLEVQISSPTTEVRAQLSEVARVLAYMIAAARRYTDQFERIRRRRDLQLAAEMQWELLPVLAYTCAEYDIAGSLEPAYEIGGDTFDYAVAPTELTVSVSDAMGHGLRSAMLASLAVTTMRNVRRQGDGVVEQATSAAAHLSTQFAGEHFVTLALLRVDVPSGATAVINAGHPLPILVRDGVVSTVQLAATPPLGMFAETLYVPERLQLRPGDRLVLISDGMVEAKPVGGEPLGDIRLHELLRDMVDLSAVETVRQLTSAVVAHRAGDLQDDATAVCLDWRGVG